MTLDICDSGGSAARTHPSLTRKSRSALPMCSERNDLWPATLAFMAIRIIENRKRMNDQIDLAEMWSRILRHSRR